MDNKYVHTIAFCLLIVGGINWGLHALGYNVVNMVLGSWPQVEMIVYLLVGISAIYVAATHKGTCSLCRSQGSSMM